MTFEEFFIKKKIDLDALAKAEPELFSEFKSHYNLMGEKSFDHTKKFWFNKLRRLYHLSTTEKAITQLETKIASQAEPLSSPTIEQKPAPSTASDEPTKTVAKPAFKPRNIPVKVDEKKEETPLAESPEATATPVKKPGFKPRNIKPAEAEDTKSLESRPGKTEVSDTPVTNLEEDKASKPAYKPKFNMRNVSRSPGEAADQAGDTGEKQIVPQPESKPEGETETVETPKPAYKPKFNLKNISKAKVEDTISDSANERKEEVTTAQSEEESSETPKPAYRPRFNMKNLQQKPAEKVEEEKPAAPNETISVEPASQTTTSEETPLAKPAYKPRFNMKNLSKPKTEEDSGESLAQKQEDKLEENSVSETPQTESEENVAKPEEIKSDEPSRSESEIPEPKPAYKPRFNMRNIKPKPSADSE